MTTPIRNPQKPQPLPSSGNEWSEPLRPVQTAVCKYLQTHNPAHPLVQQYTEQLNRYQSYRQTLKEEYPEVPQPEAEPLAPLSLKSFRGLIINTYQQAQGVKFNKNANEGEADLYLQTLLYYFARDSRFYHSPLLAQFGGVENNLSKGLLVIGGYGCGKTSLFQTLHSLFSHALTQKVQATDINGNKTDFARYRFYFKYFTANEVVEEYENCQTPADKEHFWNQHKRGLNYYDDVLTERPASNYGKFELFKDLLEKRYANRSPTLISCNYYNGSTEGTLEYFKQKYGARVCDRLYAMFNIVELKGGTLRR